MIEDRNITDSAVRREFINTFRSLKYRNYRLYFMAQLLSLTGTWMQQVALSWLVYRMTRSALMLGFTEGAQLLPVLALGLVGGWFADRVDRQKILIATQTLAMCQAVILALLTLSGHIEIWHCVVLALLVGVINAFEIPARQAFLSELVDRKDLVNAVSLNSSVFTGARIAGPAVAGLLIPLVGEGTCFAINAFSFVATVIAFSLIRVTEKGEPKTAEGGSVFAESFQFIKLQPHVLRLLFLGAAMSFFGMNYNVLMPIFASEILHGDVRTLAGLRAAAGVGALIAALLLASRGSGDRLQAGIGYASMTFGSALILFAWSTSLVFSVPLILIAGFAMTSQLSGGHSLIQLAATDKLRGRVLSIYMTIMLGLAPLGSLAIGWAASKWGAPQVVTWCAVMCILAGIFYTLSGLTSRKLSGKLPDNPTRPE